MVRSVAFGRVWGLGLRVCSVSFAMFCVVVMHVLLFTVCFVFCRGVVRVSRRVLSFGGLAT